MTWRRPARPSAADAPRRTSTWSPPANDPPRPVPTIRRDLEVRWSTNAGGHLVVYRPPCGVRGCALPSMVWCRCATCRKILGRCHEHARDEQPVDLRAVHCRSAG